MPNLHEMGGENAAMIAAQLKEVTVHAAATVSSGFVISPEQILQTAKDIGEPSVPNRAMASADATSVSPTYSYAKSSRWRIWASGTTSVSRLKVYLTALDAGYPRRPLYAAGSVG
ncbi:hypothetical protein MJ584_03920 [Klebsiella pneumoniae]|nr:hypothetical protein MJ584_03920 [Klebsiella pneumoniae]